MHGVVVYDVDKGVLGVDDMLVMDGDESVDGVLVSEVVDGGVPGMDGVLVSDVEGMDPVLVSDVVHGRELGMDDVLVTDDVEVADSVVSSEVIDEGVLVTDGVLGPGDVAGLEGKLVSTFTEEGVPVIDVLLVCVGKVVCSKDVGLSLVPETLNGTDVLLLNSLVEEPLTTEYVLPSVDVLVLFSCSVEDSGMDGVLPAGVDINPDEVLTPDNEVAEKLIE